MKRIIFSLLLVSFTMIGNVQAQSIDVLHYRFHIELNDTNDSIYGKAEIKLVVLKRIFSIPLALTGTNSKAKGMQVINVLSNGHTAFVHKNDLIEIKAERPYSKGDTVDLTIIYKGIPADGLIISKNKYGHRSFFADNWPDRGHNWLPCHDVPHDKASVEFLVTAPQHYQVVANGIQLEETNLGSSKKRTHWREDVPVSTKVMVIGVADFAVNLAGMIDNCIPVYSWVYPEDLDKGFYDYAQAMEIMPFFIRNVGPYAYKKLANVQSKTIFGGLENANTIFYSETSVSGNRKSEALLAHEIAHQWFGNMATEKTFAHLWLSEGFATYMTILYLENKYGPDTASAMLQQDRREVIAHAKNSNRPIVDTTHNYMDLLNANSYQKGGWVLHMLRRELGDSTFWKAVRLYYATYAGSIADTDDLRKIFESVSGKDLKQFFTQWLFTPGIPTLNIAWAYSEKNKTADIVITQQNTSFIFPLEIHLLSKDGTTIKKSVDQKSKDLRISIPVNAKPVKLIIDPDTSLLADWKIEER